MRWVQHFLILTASVAVLYGCAAPPPKPPAARTADDQMIALFHRVLSECEKADCTPVAAISLLRSHYILPASVDLLIAKRADALPILERLARSPEYLEAELARAIIALIEAPSVKTGESREDPRTGVTLVTFTVDR
jgi:hypothetical protein